MALVLGFAKGRRVVVDDDDNDDVDAAGAGVAAAEGGGGAGISRVIEVVVLIPITSRLLTSSYVDGAMSGRVSGTPDDRDGSKLLGCPFIRFKIIWVAAVN